jgi:cytoskeleton protein RodZ
MSIGSTLKEARESKSLSIIDIASATRMNKKYIQALEDDNYMMIPSQVYAKGHLKTYANYLGLDVGQMMEELSGYYKGKDEQKRMNSPVKKNANPIQLNFNPIYLIYVISFICLISFIIYEVKVTGITMNASVATPEAEAVKVVEKPVVTVVKPVEVVPLKGVKVMAMDDTRIIVVVDGNEVYRGILEKAHWINFRGKQIVVKADNAGDVKVYMNGEDLGTMGEDGKSAELTYNPYK